MPNASSEASQSSPLAIVGGAIPEHLHRAFVRQAGAGHEVHHHLRGGRVEAADRHAFAGGDARRRIRRGRRPP